MCAPSPPPAPDVVGAAQAQGVANQAAAEASSRLNNPNVINPAGTQIWTEGAGSADRPTVTQSLSPENQALYDQGLATKSQLGEVAGQGAEALKGIVGTQIDFGGAPGVGNTEATRANVLRALNSRIDEDFTNRREGTNSELIARGLRPGTKAYDDAMFQLERGRTDAKSQAEATAGAEVSRQFGIDTQARKDYIAELLSKRQVPLNEITALMSGSQVQNPFAVPGASQNANVAPAPLYPAALQNSSYQTDLYNADVGAANSRNSAIAGLGVAGALAFF